jgi:hypothetical protein
MRDGWKEGGKCGRKKLLLAYNRCFLRLRHAHNIMSNKNSLSTARCERGETMRGTMLRMTVTGFWQALVVMTNVI